MKVSISLKNLDSDKYGVASIEATNLQQVDGLVEELTKINYKVIGIFPSDVELWEQWQSSISKIAATTTENILN